jgi:hypothetical protein
VLAIVSNIVLEGETATGGDLKIVDPWEPDDADLVVLRWRYRPPPDGRNLVG